jgi:hypothetical protein
MSKLNCWQYKNCGREKGGLLAAALGECPVSSAMKYDGLNGGRGAGRSCWMVEDAACRTQDGSYRTRCCTCDFYKRVVHEQEENTHFRFTSVPA